MHMLLISISTSLCVCVCKIIEGGLSWVMCVMWCVVYTCGAYVFVDKVEYVHVLHVCGGVCIWLCGACVFLLCCRECVCACIVCSGGACICGCVHAHVHVCAMCLGLVRGKRELPVPCLLCTCLALCEVLFC